MRRGVLVRRAGVAAALVAAVCVGSTGSATGQQGCVSPYAPILSGQPYPLNDVVELPGTPVPSVQLRPTSQIDPTGAAYIVSAGLGPTVTVVLPTGTLELTMAGGSLQGLAAGDLDGDGISDVVVVDSGVGESFFVRSTTAPGTYDLTTVGTRLPPGVPFGTVDWPRDGSADLVLGIGANPAAVSGSTAIVDGAAVLAAGPGGDATGAVLAAIDGMPSAVLQYPTGSFLATLQAGGAAAIVRVADRTGTIELTTAPGPNLHSAPDNAITASVHQQRRFLHLANSSRSGNLAWLWALDDPCAPVTAAAAATPAPTPSPREAGLRSPAESAEWYLSQRRTGSRGSPSRRSARMLRRMFVVPPMIV